MNSAPTLNLQAPLAQATARANAALAGTWKLPARRAVTLRPARPGRLSITVGRAWATLDGPHELREGDLVLERGQGLPVRAGQRIVLEPWGRQADAPVWFSWEPEP